jgi:transposase
MARWVRCGLSVAGPFVCRCLTSGGPACGRGADWLLQCWVTTVAMEPTGVYWISLYEILEQRGIRPCLVNARHMKNVPGRRTDWHECQWVQFLHSVGLLRVSFRPQQDICAVRTVLRHRRELVMAASQHVQHMHKAVTQMNLQIHHEMKLKRQAKQLGYQLIPIHKAA